MNLMKMKKQLKGHEGEKKNDQGRHMPYKDTVGKWTIGWGRNISDNGISEEEATFLLDSDIYNAMEDVRIFVSNFEKLDDVRQHVLIDMAFNLGRSRLSKFKRMIAAVQRRNFGCAADEMVDSKWYRQGGVRGARLELMMRTGKDSN